MNFCGYASTYFTIMSGSNILDSHLHYWLKQLCPLGRFLYHGSRVSSVESACELIVQSILDPGCEQVTNPCAVVVIDSKKQNYAIWSESRCRELSKLQSLLLVSVGTMLYVWVRFQCLVILHC